MCIPPLALLDSSLLTNHLKLFWRIPGLQLKIWKWDHGKSYCRAGIILGSDFKTTAAESALELSWETRFKESWCAWQRTIATSLGTLTALRRLRISCPCFIGHCLLIKSLLSFQMAACICEIRKIHLESEHVHPLGPGQVGELNEDNKFCPLGLQWPGWGWLWHNLSSEHNTLRKCCHQWTTC